MPDALQPTTKSPWRALGALVLTVVSAGLLFVGALFFAFTGYCEDSCDRPPWTLWRALQNGLPFAAVAVGLMTVVAFMTMRRVKRSWVKALIASVVLCCLFVGALVLIVAVVAVVAVVVV